MSNQRKNTLNPYRTSEEVDELKALMNDTEHPEAARKARVVLQMNADNEDGTSRSYNDRIIYTRNALEVSLNYIERCLRLYNVAGINGLLRKNDELKPDILERTEDHVKTPSLTSNELFTSEDKKDFYERKAIEEAAQSMGKSVEEVMEVWAAIKETGADIGLFNPTRTNHMLCKDDRHCEIAGYFLGDRFGILAIATKNVEEAGNTRFILKKVFNNTEVCQETVASFEPLYQQTQATGENWSSEEKYKLFFQKLQEAYNINHGWRVHCYAFKEDAREDANGVAIIEGLPTIKGYTYETTYDFCDFTSPFKAAFSLAYFRDNTNVQGWKIRDRVINIIRETVPVTGKPVMYVGAGTDIFNPNLPYIQMMAKAYLPGVGTTMISISAQMTTSLEGLSSSSMDEFQEAISTADFNITDMTREFAGMIFQGVINASQLHAPSEETTFSPVLVEAESGRKQVWLSKTIAQNYGKKRMLYTVNLVNLIGNGVTEQSFREATDAMNTFLHRKAYEQISYTTIQDLITREGLHIQQAVEAECEKGLQMYKVEIVNGKVVSHEIPESAIKPAIANTAIPHYDIERIKRKLARRNKYRSEDDQLTLEQVMEALASMEKNPQKTVYVMFDGVVVKKQKEHRKQEAETTSNTQDKQENSKTGKSEAKKADKQETDKDGKQETDKADNKGTKETGHKQEDSNADKREEDEDDKQETGKTDKLEADKDSMQEDSKTDKQEADKESKRETGKTDKLEADKDSMQETDKDGKREAGKTDNKGTKETANKRNDSKSDKREKDEDGKQETGKTDKSEADKESKQETGKTDKSEADKDSKQEDSKGDKAEADNSQDSKNEGETSQKTTTKKRGRKKKNPETQADQTVVNQEEDKKTIEIHNVYILYKNQAYIITAPTMEQACRNALGFLLKTKLLEGNELVFFSDGARTIKDTIQRYFSFREYHLYLDWYHVSKKCYQFFTQYLKGGKTRLKENEEIRKQFFNLLWEGNFEACKEYIRNIDPSIVKDPQQANVIINYLERKKEHLYCYNVRKLVGLINASNRVEQANNVLVSKRQKKNGMAWCPVGSRSLAAVTMIYQNKIDSQWFKTRTISFEMHATKVSSLYTAEAA